MSIDTSYDEELDALFEDTGDKELPDFKDRVASNEAWLEAHHAAVQACCFTCSHATLCDNYFRVDCELLPWGVEIIGYQICDRWEEDV